MAAFRHDERADHGGVVELCADHSRAIHFVPSQLRIRQPVLHRRPNARILEAPMPNQPKRPLPALLVSTALSLSGAAWATPAAADLLRVGVAGAVNPATSSTQPDGNKRTLVIGNDVIFKERITTDAGGKTQLLFLDRSALSVGPNAELTIDEFVFDPATGRGKLAINAAVGVFRFVGGKLSKAGDVEIRTPSAVTGIRGGIAIIEVGRDGSTTATLVFGRQLTVTATNGTQQMVQKPGFSVTVTPAAATPTAQARPTATTINRQLDNLEAAPRQGASASSTPTQAAAPGATAAQPAAASGSPTPTGGRSIAVEGGAADPGGGRSVAEDRGAPDPGGGRSIAVEGGAAALGGGRSVAEDRGAPDPGGGRSVAEDRGAPNPGGGRSIAVEGGAAALGGTQPMTAQPAAASGSPTPTGGQPAATSASVFTTQITAGAIEARLAPSATAGGTGTASVTVTRPASTTTVTRSVTGPTTLSTSPLTPTAATTVVTVPRLPPPPPISTIRPATTAVSPRTTTTPTTTTVLPPPRTTTTPTGPIAPVSPPPDTSSPSKPVLPVPTKPGEPTRPTPPTGL
ncbi:MAG: hypothetical protein EXQ85_09275 [Alphaproteobacteria bacterium]|nr:hypothetical protein [Alphaproteobacteria bacterium]